MKVNKWKVYCETDAKWECLHLEETALAPTTCPVNTAHTITAGSAVIIDYVSDTETRTINKLRQDDVATHNFGAFFTATKGITTHHYVPIITKYIQGGYLEVENHVWPNDKYSVKIVDKDNVLGNGVDFVLNDFLKDIPLRKDGKIDIKSHAISGAIPAGMYLKYSITSTGATNDIKCATEVYGYEDV